MMVETMHQAQYVNAQASLSIPWQGLALLGLLILAFFSIWKWELQRMRRARERFLRDRHEQTDREFLIEAGAQPDQEEFFLAGRRVMADLSGVPPELVHAQDKATALFDLQFDSGDVIEFLMGLEDEADVKLPCITPPDDPTFGDYLAFLYERRSPVIKPVKV
ncbi:MAG: hypothetical protein ACP5XB_16370 [Isosphaeraceae bacterium]